MLLMASERKPELIIVDTLKDKHGRTVKVGYRGGDVEIIVTPHSGHDGRMAFDGGQRDRFITAWAKAERLSEADDAKQPEGADDEVELLTYDEAVALLPGGDRIHTFLESPVGLIGADWDRGHILELLAATGRREVTGPAAQSTGHGLAAYREDGIPVFIATRRAEPEPVVTGGGKVQDLVHERYGLPASF